jgi:hypothetical protein
MVSSGMLRRVALVVPSSPILVTLMKEVRSSSETSVLTRATRRNIPEVTILQLPGSSPQVWPQMAFLDEIGQETGHMVGLTLFHVHWRVSYRRHINLIFGGAENSSNKNCMGKTERKFCGQYSTFPVSVEVSGNLHRTCRHTWIVWPAQGTPTNTYQPEEWRLFGYYAVWLL